MNSNWHAKSTEEVLQALAVDPAAGLDSREASRRLQQYGGNKLNESSGRGPGKILLEQFQGTLVVMLIVAAIVSMFLNEWKDAVVILFIVLINALLGFVQDYRAEKTLARLKEMATPNALLLRNGRKQEVQAQDLVPGDILFLETGRVIPADARVITSSGIKTEEAALTGESTSVDKDIQMVSEEKGIADRTNMLFAGTQIVAGRGTAVVTATGMATELGKIAGMLSEVTHNLTPLQKRLGELGKGLAIAAILIVAVVFLAGVLRGEDTKLMFMTALGLAVAAVPEGLPAVATVSLAIGAKRMFRANALIRKLPAVETLGSVTTICSDKTGTLTQNKMTLHEIWTCDNTWSLEDEKISGTAKLALISGALCNDATEDENGPALGEPTECAFVNAATKCSIPKSLYEREFPRLGEVAFTSERKLMTTLHHRTKHQKSMLAPLVFASERVSFSKGATEMILKRCTRLLGKNSIKPLSPEDHDTINKKVANAASNGFRVLALAANPSPSQDQDHLEEELIFLGLAFLVDPPRPEVLDAVTICRQAGIRPIMITGDHPATAKAIAQQLDITRDDLVCTGLEITNATDSDFSEIVKSTSVFARVAPQHKLRIVEMLQNQNQVVAMTGDGVNDAPALKKSDIGVAMGITGTDVSKEAAEMVLLDDNFQSIVKAVEQGRIVYDNIRKFVRYTLTSNAGEILVMLIAPFLGLPLPLLPLQILWVNLVTDGLPGLALAVEPGRKSIMTRPPYPPNENIFARGMAVDIVWIGLLMGAVSIGAGLYFAPESESDLAYFRSIVFTVLTMSQLGNAMAVRSEDENLWQIGLFSNRFMILSILGTFILQIAVLYIPVFQQLLGTTALSVSDLLICLVLSSITLVAVEGFKVLKRTKSKAKTF